MGTIRRPHTSSLLSSLARAPRLSVELIEKMVPKPLALWWIVNPGETELRDRPELCLCFILGLSIAMCTAGLAAGGIYGKRNVINTPGTFQNVLGPRDVQERHYTCHTGACAPRSS